jgi:hypothetical protein
MNKLKVFEGKRRQLECNLIEAICLSNTKTYEKLVKEPNSKANLTVANNLSSNTAITEALPKPPKNRDDK